MIQDTIIAKAAPPGSAFRGIVRISGTQALSVAKTIAENAESLTMQRHSSLVETQILLPSFPPFPAKWLLWQEGHSYTGDETVEIHTIGSPVLLDAVMTTLLTSPLHIRLAKPGEFTLRAFLSGRLDLAQAEAVLGIIDAENDTDLKTALHQLAGNLSAPLSAVRNHLWESLIRLEASLDFAEEETPDVSLDELWAILADTYQQIEQIRQQITLRGIAGGKPKIVLTGMPNVGKSTLFNKLLKRDAALVSTLAGTTRDYLEEEINWEGIPAILIDTAGISNETRDTLDEQAQLKAQELLKQADVIIYCDENDADIPSFPIKPVLFQTKRPNESLDSLRKEVAEALHRQSKGEILAQTALRCRESLNAASESLLLAQELTDLSLIALELRNAINQLGLIDGSVHTEDILESIFSRFCIGK